MTLVLGYLLAGSVALLYFVMERNRDRGEKLYQLGLDQGKTLGHIEGYQHAVADISRGAELAQQDQEPDGTGSVPLQRPDS